MQLEKYFHQGKCKGPDTTRIASIDFHQLNQDLFYYSNQDKSMKTK